MSFNKNRAKKDGYSHYCKECEHEARRKSASTSSPKAKARAKRYYTSDKGRANRRSYYYKLKNENRLPARKINNEQNRMYQLKRRARLANNGIYLISNKDYKKLLSQNCFYCDNVAEALDHVIPVSRGGRHSYGNLVPACKPCNSSKHNKTITEWQKAIRYSSLSLETE